MKGSYSSLTHLLFLYGPVLSSVFSLLHSHSSNFLECLIPYFSKLFCLCFTVFLLFFSLRFSCRDGPTLSLVSVCSNVFLLFCLELILVVTFFFNEEDLYHTATLVAYRFIVIWSVRWNFQLFILVDLMRTAILIAFSLAKVMWHWSSSKLKLVCSKLSIVVCPLHRVNSDFDRKGENISSGKEAFDECVAISRSLTSEQVVKFIIYF